MKKFLLDFIKALAKVVILLMFFFGVYVFLMARDVKRIDDFCAELKPGLDVNQIHVIAEKYDINSKRVRDPNAVREKRLGSNYEDENIWYFAVGASMTMGEHACMVHHDNKVVISAKAVW